MALPPIQVQIVAGGHEKVLDILKTVEKAQLQSEDRVRRIRTQSQQTQKSEIRQMDAVIKQSSDKRVKMREDEAKKMAGASRKAHDEELRMQKSFTDGLISEFRRRSHFMNSTMKMFGSPGPSQIARGGRSTNLSSLLGAGGGGGGGAAASEGGAAAAGGAALAGGLALAAVAAVALIKTSFDILVEGIKAGVGVFTEAILQIGGGFSVSGALVKGAKAEKDAVELAISLPGSVNPAVMKNMAMRLSKGSKIGTSQEQFLEAGREWATKTGSMEGFEGNAEFMEKISAKTGASMKDVAENMARLKAQMPKISEKELQNLVLGLVGKGQQGSLEFRDMGQVAKLTGTAAFMKGGVNPENINKLVGLGEAVERFAPGQQASTELRNTLSQVFKAAAKDKGVAAAVGAKVENGEITNFEEVLKNMVVMSVQDPGKLAGLKGLKGARVMDTVAHLRGAAGIEGTDDEATMRKKMDAEFGKLIGATTTMEEVDKGFKELSETIDKQVKRSFNELNIVLQENLMPALREIVGGPLVDFVRAFKENSVLIKDAGALVVDFLKVFGSMLELLSPIIKLAAEAFLAGYLGMVRVTEMAMTQITGILKNIPGMGDVAKDAEKFTLRLGGLGNTIEKTMSDLHKPVNDITDSMVGAATPKQLEERAANPNITLPEVVVEGSPSKEAQKTASDMGGAFHSKAFDDDMLKKAGSLFRDEAFDQTAARRSGTIFGDAFIEQLLSRADDVKLPTNGQPPSNQNQGR